MHQGIRRSGHLWVVGAAIFLGVGATLLFQKFSGPEDFTSLTQRVLESVVKIETFDENGNPSGFGTGFIIGENLVASAWHVVDEAARVTATDSAGRVYEAVAVEGADPYGDAVIFSLEDCAVPALKLAVDVADVVPGERVIVVGTPSGYAGTVTEGVVSSVRPRTVAMRTVSEIQFSAAISPGSSGSPVVDIDSGKVIGIVTKQSEGELVNFAVGVDVLRAAEKTPLLYMLPDWADQHTNSIKASPATAKLWSDYLDHGNASRWAEAQISADGLLAKLPDNPTALHAAGMTRSKQGKFSEALPLLIRAAQGEPQLGIHWQNLTIVYHSLGRHAEALDAASKRLKCWPDEDNSHRLYAAMLWLDGRQVEAERALAASNQAFGTARTIEEIINSIKP